ncbi:MAG: glutamate--tRNA ligase [Candidatus Woesearchaeota archaeon]
MDVEQLKSIIRKHALANALKFNGKASSGAVISKIIAEAPETKQFMKTVSFEVSEVLQDINSMKVEDIQKELEANHPEMLEKKDKEKREDLRELDGVDASNGVIMRFAPSPSGPMHLGHAITGGLTALYVKKYGGKFILRIEDTNSDNIDLESYELLPKDAEWIFGNVSEVWIQSDRMEIYYNYAKKFIELGACYVCTCSQEKFKEFSDNMTDCPCRNLNEKENMFRWNRMLKNYKEGEAVLRFKTNMQHNNPAMRDFPLARINDSEHPRQKKKYRVWPLMNLSVCVDDIEAKMTHIIRAKDHADNAKRQEMMYDALGIKDQFPKTYFLGRYNFEGLELSASKTRAKIEKGEYWGWDDIRLPFLQALKRRGYQPEALLRYTMLTGISPVDKTVSAEEFFKTINSFNKEIIDPKAKRFFMMHDYETIIIHNAPHQELKLKMHPNNDSYGYRELEVEKEFLILKSDLKELKNDELYRFMDCLNFKKIDDRFEFDSLDYENFKNNGKKIMHFLPAYGNIDIEILMDDATVVKGVAEHTIKNLKIGEIIQFERFGFCRLDEINKEKKLYKFWFTHK